MAESIASKDNPLTARVFVNRVWQHHFGAGIVRTASDFGHQGERPTDPALLDYLASTFMENGWSIKKLQRMIVTSATYRQSAAVSQPKLEADPENRTWSRMNRHRLDLEEMRDSLLSAAGDIDLSRVGGKSVDLWSQPFAKRRAVYGFVDRQNLSGTFRTFDLASPDSTSSGRFETTVPQQALFFMNSAFAVDQARSLTNRPEIQGSKDDAQRIRRLYRLLFQRQPTADELSVGLGYLKPGALSPVTSPSGVWQYGYGGFDAGSQRVKGFSPLAHFAGDSYRVGATFPDPTLGYLVLNPIGGHPGHDGDHAVIRRWIAPANLTVHVAGLLSHGQGQGDGVRARIVSSRSGLLGEWRVHNTTAKTDVASVTVLRGDTIDFVVDDIASDSFDAFAWAPTIKSLDGKYTWDAAAGFGPPPPPDLLRLTLYAQALMMTNEFMFVD